MIDNYYMVWVEGQRKPTRTRTRPSEEEIKKRMIVSKREKENERKKECLLATFNTSAYPQDQKYKPPQLHSSSESYKPYKHQQ